MATKRETYADYAAIPAVNWSTLKLMRRSPLHYRHALENPRQDTTRLALGRACHTAVFEPDMFMRHYACFDGERRAGKAWEAFKAANPNRTILKLDEYETCLRVRDAVRAHPVAASMLVKGEHEKTIKWTDAETGVDCKGRLDWLSAQWQLVDLKTTDDVGADRFAATSARMLYHAQLAMYVDGIGAITGDKPTAHLIAVEIKPPHDVAVYEVDEDALYAGSEIYRDLLRKLKQCRETDRWPGRHPERQTLRLPSWAWPDEEYDTAIDDEISFGARSE